MSVIIRLRNLWGQSGPWKFISFLPGGHQEFSKGHIKCHVSQHFLKTEIIISQSPPCWFRLVTWFDCYALHRWRAVKQPKPRKGPFLRFMWPLHILCRCWTRCDALSKVLKRCSDIRSKCVQLKSCASQWRTGLKFGANGILLARGRRTLVRNKFNTDYSPTDAQFS